MTKIDSKYIFQERIKGLLIIAENLVLEHERKGENVAVFKKLGVPAPPLTNICPLVPPTNAVVPAAL